MFVRLLLLVLCFYLPVNIFGIHTDGQSPSIELRALYVKKCTDFTITGSGKDKNWSLTEWVTIPQRKIVNEALETKVKVLYSKTGLYFLFFCKDKKLTATMNADRMDLWKEDVVEVFLMPDESCSVYFEYEISPLNYELPILVSNENGDLVRWAPFHYDEDRKVAHATTVQGGETKHDAAVTSWMAEFFIPYKLLRPLKNITPTAGTNWKANLCRIDYEDQKMNTWSWKLTQKNFHDYKSFGTLLFE